MEFYYSISSFNILIASATFEEKLFNFAILITLSINFETLISSILTPFHLYFIIGNLTFDIGYSILIQRSINKCIFHFSFPYISIKRRIFCFCLEFARINPQFIIGINQYQICKIANFDLSSCF